MAEQWATVPGYPEYRVSSSGRVQRKQFSCPCCDHVEWEDRATTKVKTGYLVCSLENPSGRRQHFVHRLVVESFVGHIPEGMVVNHIDGNKANNTVENLEVVTPKENVHHSIRTGLRWNPKGEQHAQCKTSEAAVRNVFALRKQGLTIKAIAAETGIPITNVKNIIYRSWRHIRNEP